MTQEADNGGGWENYVAMVAGWRRWQGYLGGDGGGGGSAGWVVLLGS